MDGYTFHADHQNYNVLDPCTDQVENLPRYETTPDGPRRFVLTKHRQLLGLLSFFFSLSRDFPFYLFTFISFSILIPHFILLTYLFFHFSMSYSFDSFPFANAFLHPFFCNLCISNSLYGLIIEFNVSFALNDA